MEVRELRKGFSYSKPCVNRWENVRSLRKLGIQGKPILVCADQNADENAVVHPSLANISRNYDLLKGFTSHMAATGVICTRLIDPLKVPVVDFYDLMQVDVSTPQATSVCHGVASQIKKMLGHIRRKWGLWEMPRVPGFN